MHLPLTLLTTLLLTLLPISALPVPPTLPSQTVEINGRNFPYNGALTDIIHTHPVNSESGTSSSAHAVQWQDSNGDQIKYTYNPGGGKVGPDSLTIKREGWPGVITSPEKYIKTYRSQAVSSVPRGIGVMCGGAHGILSER